MTLSQTTGALKRFRRTPWRFQQTFHTPLQSLPGFVSAILSVCPEPKSASLVIEEVVFEPPHLLQLLAKHRLPSEYKRDTTLVATGTEEVRELLENALSDWIDFAFVPAPKPFVIYADHDEYTTFLANTRSSLNKVAHSLLERGFKQVADYERTFE